MLDINKKLKESIEYGKKINDGTNSGGDLFLNDNILYKYYGNDTSFISERERNIRYLKEKRLFRPEIYKIYYDSNYFIGYSQEYINNSKTFKEGINDDTLDYNEKCKFINDIFRDLKKLHNEDIFLGDVHSKNFIYNDEGGFIVDLDCVRFKDEDEFKFMEYYLIKEHDNTPMIKKASRYTDNVKATISSLSLLYGFDFEEICKNHSLDTVRCCLDTYTSDESFKQDIEALFSNKHSVVYFDDILNKNKQIVKTK